jgi:hypothetical protein
MTNISYLTVLALARRAASRASIAASARNAAVGAHSLLPPHPPLFWVWRRGVEGEATLNSRAAFGACWGLTASAPESP